MSRKRTATQLWQKRARDKESRLRRRGAVPESVSVLSPRKDWEEVQAMTPGQKVSYVSRLKKFVSRDNRIAIENGIAYHAKLGNKGLIGVAVETYNKKVRTERERIDNIAVDKNVPGAGNISTIKQRQRERNLEREGTKGKFRVRGATASALYEMTVEEEARTPEIERLRAERLAEMARRTWADKREGLRQSAIEMLLRIGDEEAAEAIERMSGEQFDVLSQRTDFFDTLSVAYAPSAGTKAAGVSISDAAEKIALSESPLTGDYSSLIGVVEQAVPMGDAYDWDDGWD